MAAFAGLASSSAAAAGVFAGAPPPSLAPLSRRVSLQLPRRSLSSDRRKFSYFCSDGKMLPFSCDTDRCRFSSLRIRATSSEETSGVQTDELLSDLKEKWDALENKSIVFLYGGGAIVAVWLSTVLVGAVNSVPLLPKIMELVGLGYTGWFVYRYVLFKSSRKELASVIEDVKKKIAGTEEYSSREEFASDIEDLNKKIGTEEYVSNTTSTTVSSNIDQGNDLESSQNLQNNFQNLS